jgi:tetratricopeptide (TPR) repeat protein
MFRILLAVFTLTAGIAVAAPADDLVVQGNESLRKMDVVAAMTAFTAALEADPKHAEAAYQRGRILLKINEPQKAILDFTTVVLVKPDHGRAFARRGEAKIVLKNWAEAFVDFDQAIQVSPKDHEVFVVRATYRLKRGELAGAIADMEAAIAVADAPTAARLRKMLGVMQ